MGETVILMRIVCIESPYSDGATEPFQHIRGNIGYAEACLLHAFQEGVAPFASHLLYTRVLKDGHPNERKMGMNAGHAIGDRCDERWFYLDRGMSKGMRVALERAKAVGQITRDIVLGDQWKLHR